MIINFNSFLLDFSQDILYINDIENFVNNNFKKKQIFSTCYTFCLNCVKCNLKILSHRDAKLLISNAVEYLIGKKIFELYCPLENKKKFFFILTDDLGNCCVFLNGFFYGLYKKKIVRGKTLNDVGINCNYFCLLYKNVIED